MIRRRPVFPAIGAKFAVAGIAVTLFAIGIAQHCFAPGARAEASVPASTQADSFLESIKVEQRLGKPLPLDARFTDSSGRMLALDDIFDDRPVIVAPAYYECPMLCSLVLSGLVKALKPMGLVPGRDFEVVVLSFDAGETPELAAKSRAKWLENYGHEGTDAGWHFLTGETDSIKRVLDAIGYSYSYDSARDEYAHGAAVVVATPKGNVARYLFGVDFSSRDLRLALVEAADERIGTFIDQLLLYCYHYDPSRGEYTATALTAVRVAGAATLVLMLAGFVMLRRREAP